MTMVIDGKQTAKEIRAELREAEMRIYRKGEKNGENCGFSESTRL